MADETQFSVQIVNLEDGEYTDYVFPYEYLTQNVYFEFIADKLTPGDIYTSIFVDRGPNNDYGRSVFDAQLSIDALQIAIDGAAGVSSGFQRIVNNCVGVRMLNKTTGKLTGRIRVYPVAQIVRKG